MRVRRWRVPIPTRGHTLWYSIYMLENRDRKEDNKIGRAEIRDRRQENKAGAAKTEAGGRKQGQEAKKQGQDRRQRN